MAEQRVIRYHVLVNGERYLLPLDALNANETLRVERNLRNRQVPGAERAFLVGDGEWQPGRITLAFDAIGSGSQAAYDAASLIDDVEANCSAATSLIREVNVGALALEQGGTLGTESGEDIAHTLGTARALLGVSAFEVSEYEMLPAHARVSVTWFTRFGIATDHIAETRSEFDGE